MKGKTKRIVVLIVNNAIVQMAYCVNGVLEALKIKTMLTLVGEEITCKLQKAASCLTNYIS